jgi:hypothetical protein
VSYSEIMRLSKELNRPKKTLIALSDQNDPFNAGCPRRRLAAEWLADLWRRFDFGLGTHIRRVHYRLISQPQPILMPGSEQPYENTGNCWQTFREGSRDARLLGLVPIVYFVDARNGDSAVNDGAEPSDAYLDCEDDDDYDIKITLPELSLISPTILQPYHVEIIVEKTTMDDVILPLGRVYGIDVTPLAGEISLTRCRDIVLRAQKAARQGRPTRILYVSDFDPGGQSMPVACARKIEYLVRNGFSGLDIQLRPVVLTLDQCEEYEPPRTPLKETKRRAGAFEARYGEGATELDALEALYPGELRNTLVEEVESYRDRDLDDEIEEVASDLNDRIDEINQAAVENYAQEIAALEADQAALNERRRRLSQDITAFLQERAPDISAIDWPVPDGADDDPDPLFDSRRSYVDQIDRYKAYQGRPTEGKRSAAA